MSRAARFAAAEDDDEDPIGDEVEDDDIDSDEDIDEEDVDEEVRGSER